MEVNNGGNNYNTRFLSSNERNEPTTSFAMENRLSLIVTNRNNGSTNNNNNNNPNNMMFQNSSGELLVTLDKPRPTSIRDSNDYCDVHRSVKSISTNVSNNNNSRRNVSHGNSHGSLANDSALLSALNLTNNSSLNNVKKKLSSSNLVFVCRRSASVESDRFYNVKLNNLENVTGKPSSRPVTFSKSSSTSLPSTVITSQPSTSKNNSRQKLVTTNSSASTSNICPRCNKCRCSDCTTPKSLPSRWCCNRSCLLSVDNCVEYLSCMCCVNACLYHATGLRNSDGDSHDETSYKTQEEMSNFNKASSCQSCAPGCCLKWTLVGVLATLLSPCLSCYLPLKLCGKCTEWTYAKRHDYGCRCKTTTADARRPL